MESRFEALRAAMIDNQLRPTGVNDPKVLAAFASVARERFVPASMRGLAYLDEDMEISPGRHLMEPLVFGNLVMRAEIGQVDRVLLIGCGTGYEAAVISRLAGQVIAVESDPALAAAAREALVDTYASGVTVHEGPLTAGAADHGPFDILFLNGAVEHIPPELVVQLDEGGRFVGIVLDRTGVGRAVAGRHAAGALGQTAFLDAAVGRLPGFERPRGFRF